MSDALDILICSPGLPHDGECLAKRSLGGSETAAVYMARNLAKLGHSVTAFAPGAPGAVMSDGVHWIDIQHFPGYACSTPTDVVIVSRAVDYLRLRFNTKICALWNHDLALKRARGALAGVLWNLDCLYVLSDFMRRQYIEVHQGIPESIFVVTRNGIDLDAFTGLERLPRNPKKLLYGSRPERGLETVLAVMERLGKQGSDLTLHVAGYDNSPPQLQDYYNALWSRAQQMPNVRLLGPLTQAQWRRELATAKALLYPGVNGDFAEISCIVAMEAQAAGTPMVALRKGALPETLPSQAGVLVGDADTDVMSPAYLDLFATKVVEVATSEPLWRSLSFAGREHASTLDWSGVAQQWTEDWTRRLAERACDPWRLQLHLQRTGEREALAAE